MDAWKFYIEDNILEIKEGVHIRIENLHDDIKYYLSSYTNIDNLRNKIERSYNYDELQGLINIFINGTLVNLIPEKLLYSNIISPGITKKSYTNINYTIITGMGEPDPKAAGWNIICNNRFIVNSDRTELTGWNSSYNPEKEEEIDEIVESAKIPAYHNDFARFRGYVIFEAVDSKYLPFNTTKDGIDENNKIFIQAKNDMMSQMRIALPKLRKIQTLLRNSDDDKMENILNKSDRTTIYQLINKYKENRSFNLNFEKYQPEKIYKKVYFSVEENRLNMLKEFFGVMHNKEVGEKILNYFLESEGIDE